MPTQLGRRAGNRKVPPAPNVEATKNFTTHQSELPEEGRRNQPRNPSPKKVKDRHAAEHVEENARRREWGALEPFSPLPDDDEAANAGESRK